LSVDDTGTYVIVFTVEDSNSGYCDCGKAQAVSLTITIEVISK